MGLSDQGTSSFTSTLAFSIVKACRLHTVAHHYLALKRIFNFKKNFFFQKNFFLYLLLQHWFFPSSKPAAYIPSPTTTYLPKKKIMSLPSPLTAIAHNCHRP